LFWAALFFKRFTNLCLLIHQLSQPLFLQYSLQLLFHFITNLYFKLFCWLFSTANAHFYKLFFNRISVRSKWTVVLRYFNSIYFLLVLLQLLLMHVFDHILKCLLTAIESLNIHLQLLCLQGFSEFLIGIISLEITLLSLRFLMNFGPWAFETFVSMGFSCWFVQYLKYIHFCSRFWSKFKLTFFQRVFWTAMLNIFGKDSIIKDFHVLVKTTF